MKKLITLRQTNCAWLWFGISLVMGTALLTVASAQVTQPPATKSNTHSPKAVLQAYVAACNRHDFAAIDEFFARDGVYVDPAQDFRGVGPAQVKDFMQTVVKVEPDFVWKLTTIIESGSVVAAEWTWTATSSGNAPNGRPMGAAATKVTGRGATIAVIENGQIKQFHDYYDDASFWPKELRRN